MRTTATPATRPGSPGSPHQGPPPMIAYDEYQPASSPSSDGSAPLRTARPLWPMGERQPMSDRAAAPDAARRRRSRSPVIAPSSDARLLRRPPARRPAPRPRGPGRARQRDGQRRRADAPHRHPVRPRPADRRVERGPARRPRRPPRRLRRPGHRRRRAHGPHSSSRRSPAMARSSRSATTPRPPRPSPERRSRNPL